MLLVFDFLGGKIPLRWVNKKQLVVEFKRGHHPGGIKRNLLAMMCSLPRTDKLKKST